MKRIMSMVLALLICLSLTPTVFAAEESGMHSGSYDMPKMSKQEIKRLLDSTVIQPDDVYWEEVPNIDDWKQGTLSERTQQAGLARLNALRNLAGVPSVTLSLEQGQIAQDAAAMQAVIGNELNHFPTQPDGVPDDFYRRGLKGSSSTNLAGVIEFERSIDELISDRYTGNVSSVGHRRWFFNANMGSTGFGYVVKPDTEYGKFTAAYSIDMSKKNTVSYDIVAWPASGYFPNNIRAFGPYTPWSVSLNAKTYGKVTADDVTVKLTRASDGKVWNFSSKNRYEKSSTELWFTVDTSVCGDGQCIIFRPNKVGTYEGRWDVEITISGKKPATISYSVDFFNTDDLPVEETQLQGPLAWDSNPAPAFRDLDGALWAVDYINRAVEEGAVTGVTAVQYEPDRAITGYEFMAILLRGVYDKETTAYIRTPWYKDVESVSTEYGLWEGLDDTKRDEALTRADMAQIVYNVLNKEEVAFNIAVTCPFQDVTNESYALAVNVCAAYKILSGVSENVFDAESCVTRAQAAVVYCRLKDILP